MWSDTTKVALNKFKAHGDTCDTWAQYTNVIVFSGKLWKACMYQPHQFKRLNYKNKYVKVCLFLWKTKEM